MLSRYVLLLGLAGCASGQVCSRSQDCRDDEFCDEGVCSDIYGRVFDFQVVSAVMPRDKDYGDDGGAPDMFVKLVVDGDECLTSVIEDSYDPVWCETCRFVVYDDTPWTFEIRDDDIGRPPPPAEPGWYAWGSKKTTGPASAIRSGRVQTGENDEFQLTILVEPAH